MFALFMFVTEEIRVVWDEIIQDAIFIGQSVDDLNQEIEVNTWLISMSDSERAATSAESLMTFFQAVMDNRREQIQQAQAAHGMWFYVWHDSHAAQLRLSLVSDMHEKLPFAAPTIFIELSTLIREFLDAPAVLMWPLMEISDYEEYDEDEDFDEEEEQILVAPVLPVFCVQLL